MIAILIAIWLLGAIALGPYLIRTWGNAAADEKAVLLIGVCIWWVIAVIALLCIAHDLILALWRKRPVRT